MRRRQKYRLPNSNNTSRSAFPWLLLILAGAAVVWVWWHAANSPERKGVRIHPAPTPASGNPQPAATVIPRVPTAPAPPGSYPRPAQDILEAQLALERQGISSGSLDGRMGPQTHAALRAFQQKEKLPATGELDAETKLRLTLAAPTLGSWIVASNDLARLQPLGKTWLAKSLQTTLDYETILELVAEKCHAHPNLIRSLNPGMDWTNVPAGTILQVPDLTEATARAKAAFVRISLSNKILEAFDAGTNLLMHFPCSIAQRVEKRPVGELQVAVIAPNPNYTFDPDLFPESPEAKQLKAKLLLPPGPNNPVGTVWIGLDKTGYGIHGTPNPELVGRTESHGCFRLSNWNAELLLKLTWMGMPVYVEP